MNIQLEQNFKSTLDIIPNGILLIDIKTQKIMFANTQMKTMINYTKEEEKDPGFDSLRDSVCQFVLYDKEKPARAMES